LLRLAKASLAKTEGGVIASHDLSGRGNLSNQIPDDKAQMSNQIRGRSNVKWQSSKLKWEKGAVLAFRHLVLNCHLDSDI